MAKTIIIIEKGQDGTYSVYPKDLKATFIGEGNTVEEAKKDFFNSYNEILSYYSDKGLPVPEELKDLEFEYKFDLAAFFNYFNFINVSKFAESIGMEPSLMRHYKVGGISISSKQKKKIETEIHCLAHELGQIAL